MGSRLSCRGEPTDRPYATLLPFVGASRWTRTGDSLIEPLEDRLQVTATVEDSNELDAIFYGTIDDSVTLKTVSPELRAEPFAGSAKSDRRIREFLALPLKGIDEAVGI